MGYSPWDHKELDTTKRLTISDAPSDTRWMLLETWIIAEIPANSQKCSLLDFSGETDILYLLSSNHSAPAMNRVTLIKQLFSDYNKFSPEPETRALSV